MADLFDQLGADGEDDAIAPPAPKPAREWSAYQSAIFRDIAEGRKHSVIRARAGAGKTTVIVEGFNYVPKGCTVLMVAFNKSIAEELKQRAPKSVDVSTLHSYGLRAVTKAFGRLNIDGRKVDSIVRRMRGDGKGTFDARVALCKLVSLAKSSLAQTKEQLEAIINGYGIDGFGDSDKDREAAINDAMAILAECKDGLDSKSKGTNGSIDFDDMIWLPVVCALRPWQYDRVFCDEVQDFNAAQIELILRAVKPNGRICAVGDEAQAIYVFRGADSRSISNLIERLGAHVMPLSVTYRCARKIVAEANRYVPDLEPGPNAVQGEVHNCNEESMKLLAKAGDFILSRANAPLVGLCLGFLREGRRASVQGRDIGAKLAGLVKKSQATNVADLTGWISVWKSKECERLAKKEEDTTTVEDTAATIDALCENALSVAEVLARIESLFSDDDDEARIVLSTTHKAKGLERNRVFMLRDTYLRKDTEEERALAYVAITRAREVLWYVRKGGPSVPANYLERAELPSWADPEVTPVDPVAVKSGRVS